MQARDIEMSGSTTSNFTKGHAGIRRMESLYMFDDTAHAKRVFESEAGKKMILPKRMKLTESVIWSWASAISQQQASHTD